MLLLCALGTASQRQQNSMSLLQVASTAECATWSFSSRPCVPALPLGASAACGQTTFRPVVAATARSLYGADRKSALLVGACPPATYDLTSLSSWYDYNKLPLSLSSDDDSCLPATRKRRHGDPPDVTSPTASDDDEEIRNIFCAEAAVMSQAPDNGATMTSEKRHCALSQPRASPAAAVHRPSLNLYKMQVSIIYCH